MLNEPNSKTTALANSYSNHIRPLLDDVDWLQHLEIMQKKKNTVCHSSYGCRITFHFLAMSFTITYLVSPSDCNFHKLGHCKQLSISLAHFPGHVSACCWHDQNESELEIFFRIGFIWELKIKKWLFWKFIHLSILK